MKLGASAIAAFAVFSLGGCEVPRRPLPQDSHLARISFQEPMPGQCDCGFVPGVSAAYVVNQSARPVWSTVRISSSFRSTGNPIDSYAQTNLLAPGGRKFLGCTITLNEGVTSSSPNEAQCDIRNEYKPISEVYDDRSFVPTALTALNDEARRGPEYCQRECLEGTPNCQPLSADYGDLTGPIRALVEQADQGGTGIVTKQAMLATYGMEEEDDQCERGDTLVDELSVTNSGPSECMIRSTALAGLFSRRLPIEMRLSTLHGSPDISLRISQKVTMTKVPRDLFNEQARTLGIFEDLNESFYLSFKEPLLSFAGKEEIDDQNNRFAGRLRDASEIFYGPQNRRAIVLSTARGCLRFDAPRS